jgi:hypothetical protein
MVNIIEGINRIQNRRQYEQSASYKYEWFMKHYLAGGHPSFLWDAIGWASRP